MLPYTQLSKYFSSPFDVHWEEVPLQLQMELHCSEDLKSKFLSFSILDFNKNHVIWTIPQLYHLTQQVVNMFDTIYHCEQLFSQMKHGKITPCLQLSNQHLPGGLFCQPIHLTLI